MQEKYIGMYTWYIVPAGRAKGQPWLEPWQEAADPQVRKAKLFNEQSNQLPLNESMETKCSKSEQN